MIRVNLDELIQGAKFVAPFGNGEILPSEPQIIENEDGTNTIIVKDIEDPKDKYFDPLDMKILATEEDFHINSASILSLSTKQMKDEKERVHLAWLCKTDSNKLFTLSTTYLTEEDEEDEIISLNPLNDQNEFVSRLACNSMIKEMFPNYLTDMRFCTSAVDLESNEQFILDAIRILEDNSKEAVRFFVPKEVFASMSFVDDYIYNLYLETGELSAASVSTINPNPVEIFNILRLDGIISLAQIKQAPTNVAVVFRVSNGKTNDILMTTFDVGVKLPKSKFKGYNTKKLQDEYLSDADQYYTIFQFNSRLKDIDKEFLIIKAKNKNGNIKLFFLDNGICKQLETMIKEY